MARQTRKRILDASLAMFNAQGEPNVTTNHIADELEISPGNLYYHFRNKDDIIEQLFARYEERMDAALETPSARLPGLEDIWLQLHLVFECIWDYRFLYRDLVEILSRNRRLRLRFARILKRADEQAHTGHARPGPGRGDARLRRTSWTPPPPTSW
ncbi:TetR/AcrR family transcriptional regulator [Thermomonas sp.]|uniref:TetR/AcrR family transcriptional regulator n=1 Tax=Thermomonas sp. TaxID=1971895 RepID=UPI0031B9F884